MNNFKRRSNWLAYLALLVSILIISGCGGSSSDSSGKEDVIENEGGDQTPNPDPDVDPEPVALTANAGADQLALTSSQIILNGSASTGDSDLSYSWTQQSGDPVLLSSKQSSQASFTAPSKEGELIFLLTVTDEQENKNSDSVKITIMPPQDVQPVANAGTDLFITLGESVTFSADHSIDAGGSIKQYLWQQITHDEDELINLDNDQDISQTITPTQIGMVSFELTVTDDEGNTDTDTINVQVNAEDYTAPAMDADIDQWVYAGNIVTLDGRHSNGVDRGLNFNQWTQLSGEPVQLNDTSSLKTTFVAPNTIGELIFEIRGRDKTGVMGQDTVSIFVLDGQSLKPTAHTGFTQVAKTNDIVQLDGSASFDTDGTIINYKWQQLSGPTVTLLNNRSAQAEFSAPDFSGEMKFSLTVVDSQGGGDLKITSVFINNTTDNFAPVADAGEDQTVLTDSVVELTAWASYDDDKSPGAQWLWESQEVEYRNKTGNYADGDHDYSAEEHPFNPLYVRWQQISGPEVTLVSQNHIRAAFSAPATATTLVFELVAIDEHGAASTDQVTINVAQDSINYGSPLSSANVCSSQSAQCGTVTDDSGNFGFCGTCGIGSVCGGDNTCKGFGTQEYATRACELNFAQCGEIADNKGGELECGSCSNDNACVDNRCEPLPTSLQISSGPQDSLFLHLPNHLTEEDISTNRFNVTMNGRRYTEEEQISRNILTNREYTVDLASQSVAANAMTVSVKFMASHAELNEPDTEAAIDWGYTPSSITQPNIVTSDALTIVNTTEGVQAKFATNAGATLTVENNLANVQTRTCNHFAVSVGDSVNSVFNGYTQSHSLTTSDLKSLADQIKLGEYSGKAWDLRVYDRALTEEELKDLSSDCDEQMTSRTPSSSIQPRLDADNESGEYSNIGYVCSVYYCSFWWLGQDDDSADYQGHGTKRQNVFIKDEQHEFFLLDAGMYRLGDFFEFYNGNGIHKSKGEIIDNHDAQVRQSYYYSSNIYCTKGYSITSPKDCGQHANHEDFHRFQGNVKNIYWDGGGYKPLTESMAQWAGDWLGKGMDDRRMPTFTQIPHLPIWTKQDKAWHPERIAKRDEGDMAANRFAPEDMITNGVGGRQYAIYPLWAYLVQEVTGAKFAGVLWNTDDHSGDFTKSLTTLFNDINLDWRDLYLQAAAHVVTYDHAYSDAYWANEEKYLNYNNFSMSTNTQEYFKNHNDLHDSKYAANYSTEGTQGNWVPGRPQTLPGNWGHNVIKVDVNKDTTYSIKFRHNKNNLAFSEFRTQVVLFDAIAGTREYIDMPVANHGQTSEVTIESKTGQTLFLVVAQTPSQQHNRWDFDFHQYDYQINAN